MKSRFYVILFFWFVYLFALALRMLKACCLSFTIIIGTCIMNNLYANLPSFPFYFSTHNSFSSFTYSLSIKLFIYPSIIYLFILLFVYPSSLSPCLCLSIYLPTIQSFIILSCYTSLKDALNNLGDVRFGNSCS